MKINGILLLAAALAPPFAGVASAQSQYGRGALGQSNRSQSARSGTGQQNQLATGSSVTALGVVSTVNASAQSFVMHPQDGSSSDITVVLANNATFQKSGGSSASFADVVTGAKVTARGTLAGANAVTAQQVMISTNGSQTNSNNGSRGANSLSGRSGVSTYGTSTNGTSTYGSSAYGNSANGNSYAQALAARAAALRGNSNGTTNSGTSSGGCQQGGTGSTTDTGTTTTSSGSLTSSAAMASRMNMRRGSRGR